MRRAHRDAPARRGRATRRRLERETVTAPSLDASVARAEATLARLPDGATAGADGAVPVEPPAPPHVWQLGDRARSRSGDWEGRILALERGGKRATLDAGGMRVSVDITDLEPAIGVAAGAAEASDGGRRPGRRGTGVTRDELEPPSNLGALRLGRAKTVASSLDLRGARVDEALETLGRYLDDAALAGLESVTIIHGLGTGALRDAVRRQAAGHPLVGAVRAGERHEGSDGVTVLKLA